MNAAIVRSSLRLLEAGQPFALVSVIEVDGSSPATPGQKMIVLPGGATEGTVGGGGLEQRARDEALAMLARGKGGLLRLVLDARAPGGIDSLCGGTAVFAIEVAGGGPRVLLCGAGHVAHALARILVELGIPHGVVDPRAEQASAERFPHAACTDVAAPAEWISAGGLAGWSHLVIFTHDHALDGAALHAAWEAGFAGYIGLIGSERKRLEIWRNLASHGVRDEWLGRGPGPRGHCPIGIPIGARTPAQIAVSIAAEILKESTAAPAPAQD
jgi:xanthine dehydrogenase accessory factor